MTIASSLTGDVGFGPILTCPVCVAFTRLEQVRATDLYFFFVVASC